MPTQVQGLGLVDDQGNKSIVVNLSNARQMTNAEYQQLTPAQRNGAIIVTDFPIPEDDDSVTVHADGTKTWSQLLDELYDTIDKSKVANGSGFVLTNSDNTIFTPIYNNPVGSTFEGLYFVHIEATTYAISASLKPSGSIYATAQSGVVTDISSETATRDFTFHYGTSSEVMNLLTDADHCMMSNGQSVESAIGAQSVGTTITPPATSAITSSGGGIYYTRKGNNAVLSLNGVTVASAANNQYLFSIPDTPISHMLVAAGGLGSKINGVIYINDKDVFLSNAGSDDPSMTIYVTVNLILQ